MKNKIKKSIVVLGVTLTVLCSSMSVFAASCLDVRDYGYHRYNHRYLRTVSAEQEFKGIDNGKYHYVVTVNVYGKCVCGAEGIQNTYTRDEYRPIR